MSKRAIELYGVWLRYYPFVWWFDGLVCALYFSQYN